MWNRSSSNMCVQREIAREHALHKLKLTRTRSRLDNGEPRSAPHLKSRAKSLMLKRERHTKIERDNALLLRRMMDIEAKPSPIGPYIQSLKPPSTGSLNRANRVNELSKIVDENRSILQRIQTAKSNYSHDTILKQSETLDYLAAQVSTNAGRVPKVMTFNEQAYDTFSLLKSSSVLKRPVSSASKGSHSVEARPKTAGRLERPFEGRLYD